ncbi:methylated-DNA-protein-cysteine methyltransferase ogt [Mycobacterium tuberculosis T17]|nr:methylated-DNA-protein-cysteine methyltransferase ogt [Mycobacterium tuberculosis T17]
MIHYRTIDSPIGPLTLAGHGSVLTNLRMLEQTYEPSRTSLATGPPAHFRALSTNSTLISPASSPNSMWNLTSGEPTFSNEYGKHC